MLALLDGIYDGVISFEDLKKHGDFGIGTFDQLDGEMIAFDNEFLSFTFRRFSRKSRARRNNAICDCKRFEKK